MLFWFVNKFIPVREMNWRIYKWNDLIGFCFRLSSKKKKGGGTDEMEPFWQSVTIDWVVRVH